MDRIMIINGSPRAPKSNSRQYAAILSRSCRKPADYFQISRNNHLEICSQMEHYTDVVFVFPLYADSLPVVLLNFLKFLEDHPPRQKPVLSILINCGFLEYSQNEVAVQMMKLFCRQNGYRTGSILMLGGGEAILKTPFKGIAVRIIRKLARSIDQKQYRTLQTTMPLTKRLFIWASTIYWTRYGKRNGIGKKEMQTPVID